MAYEGKLSRAATRQWRKRRAAIGIAVGLITLMIHVGLTYPNTKLIWYGFGLGFATGIIAFSISARLILELLQRDGARLKVKLENSNRPQGDFSFITNTDRVIERRHYTSLIGCLIAGGAAVTYGQYREFPPALSILAGLGAAACVFGPLREYRLENGKLIEKNLLNGKDVDQVNIIDVYAYYDNGLDFLLFSREGEILFMLPTFNYKSGFLQDLFKSSLVKL